MHPLIACTWVYTSHQPALGGVKGALSSCHHCLDPTSRQKIQNLFRGEPRSLYLWKALPWDSSDQPGLRATDMATTRPKYLCFNIKGEGGRPGWLRSCPSLQILETQWGLLADGLSLRASRLKEHLRATIGNSSFVSWKIFSSQIFTG